MTTIELSFDEKEGDSVSDCDSDNNKARSHGKLVRKSVVSGLTCNCKM